MLFMTDAASKQTWMLYVFRCTRHRLHCLSRSLRLSLACYTTSYRCRKRELERNVSVMSGPASAAHSHYSLYDGMGAEVHYGSSAALSPLAAYFLTVPSTNVHAIMYGRVHADFGFTWDRGSPEVHVTQVRAEDNKIGRGRGDDSAPVCSPRLIKPVSLAFISMLA